MAERTATLTIDFNAELSKARKDYEEFKRMVESSTLHVPISAGGQPGGAPGSTTFGGSTTGQPFASPLVVAGAQTPMPAMPSQQAFNVAAVAQTAQVAGAAGGAQIGSVAAAQAAIGSTRSVPIPIIPPVAAQVAATQAGAGAIPIIPPGGYTIIPGQTAAQGAAQAVAQGRAGGVASSAAFAASVRLLGAAGFAGQAMHQAAEEYARHSDNTRRADYLMASGSIDEQLAIAKSTADDNANGVGGWIRQKSFRLSNALNFGITDWTGKKLGVDTNPYATQEAVNESIRDRESQQRTDANLRTSRSIRRNIASVGAEGFTGELADISNSTKDRIEDLQSKRSTALSRNTADARAEIKSLDQRIGDEKVLGAAKSGDVLRRAGLSADALGLQAESSQIAAGGESYRAAQSQITATAATKRVGIDRSTEGLPASTRSRILSNFDAETAAEHQLTENEARIGSRERVAGLQFETASSVAARGGESAAAMQNRIYGKYQTQLDALDRDPTRPGYRDERDAITSRRNEEFQSASDQINKSIGQTRFANEAQANLVSGNYLAAAQSQIKQKFNPQFDANGHINAYGDVGMSDPRFGGLNTAYTQANDQARNDEQRRLKLTEGAIGSNALQLARNPLGAQLTDIEAQRQAALIGKTDKNEIGRINTLFDSQRDLKTQEFGDTSASIRNALDTNKRSLEKLLDRDPIGAEAEQTYGQGVGKFMDLYRGGRKDLAKESLGNTALELQYEQKSFAESFRSTSLDYNYEQVFNPRGTNEMKGFEEIKGRIDDINTAVKNIDKFFSEQQNQGD